MNAVMLNRNMVGSNVLTQTVMRHTWINGDHGL